MVLGVPIPRAFDRLANPDDPNDCPCGNPLDPHGHHRATCKKWHKSTVTRGHDRVVHSIVDAARSCGTPCTSQPPLVPHHPHSRKHGDIYFEARILEGRSVVADVTIVHPVMGNPTSAGAAPVGTWQPRVLAARASAKLSKHKSFYSSIGLSFVPLVASTFGVLHEDFLRFLWLLSEPDSDHDLAVGEIREAGPSTPLRQLLFAKLRARASVAAAYAAAMRLLAIPLDRRPLPSSASYVPDDPSFTHDTVLSGLPIGPVGGVMGA